MLPVVRLRSLPLLGVLALACVAAPARAASPAKQIDQARAALAARQPAAAESLATLARTELAKKGRPDSLALARAGALIARARLEGGAKPDSSRTVAALADAERLDRALPKSDPDGVRALETAGLLREQAGDKAHAADWVGRAAARRRASGAAPDTAFVTMLRRLSRTESARKAWVPARSALDEALAIQRAVAPGDLAALSGVYLDRAVLAVTTKAFAAGTAQLDTAMALIEQRGGDRDSALVSLLLARARFSIDMEQVTLGIPPLERALDIARASWGPDDDRTLLVQGSLASRYLVNGDPERARDQLTEVEARLAAKPHPDRYKLAGIRYGLAGSVLTVGDTAAAIPIVERAMRGYEELGRKNEMPYLVCVEAMGHWWLRQGRLAEADSIYRAAFPLDRSRPGYPSAVTGTLYGGWFEVLDARGDYATLGPAADSLVRLYEGTPLANSFGMARGLRWRFFAELQRGEKDRARATLKRYVPMERSITTGYVRRLPDHAALDFQLSRRDAIDLMLQVTPADDPAYIRTAWTELAHWRGLVRHELGMRPLTGAANGDSVLVALRTNWAQAQNTLGRLAVAGAPAGQLRDARRRADDARRKWVLAAAQRSPDVADDTLTADRLARALQPGQALVSYVTIAVAGETPHMAAFVWRAGAPDPRLVELGPTDAIAGPVAAWDAQLRAPGTGHTPTAADERAARTAGARVKALVWTPVAREVGTAREVLVVPEGPVGDLRWPALPWDAKRYWAEAGPVVRVLNAERELLTAPLQPAAGGLLAFGGIDYAEGPTAAPIVAARFRTARTDCRDGTPPRFQPLAATAREVTAITASWPASQGPARALEGRDATEEACVELASGYRVLHLATHGYVPGDTCSEVAPGSRGVGGVSAVTAPPHEPHAVPASPAAAPAATPNLPSASPAASATDSSSIVWLAFAGADHAVAHDDPTGDGLLTPEEAMTLDLTGTEWVVLSACYATRGRDAWSREGLTGMRRAFHMAGARTVIGSSWAVGDEAGAEWMRALYAARAGGAGSAGAAIQQACATVLAARRASGRSTHPFHWASFTATGE